MSKEPGAMVSRYAPSAAPARLLCSAVIVLIILSGVTALALYLVYRPSRPRFTVLSAAVYELSNATSVAASQASVISTSMQFTVAIRNPNERASVSYDRLSAYATYRGEAVTPAIPLPPVFLERDSTVAVSPVLGGGCFPVSAEAAAGLLSDEAYGVVALRLVLLGRLRYKAGPFHGRWLAMYLRCDMLLGIKKGVTGQVPLLGGPDCDVDV